jgi:ATP-dependent protease ClpP protease subunit
MSLLKTLPAISADASLSCGSFDMRSDVMARWAPTVQAAAQDGTATISIYSAIGDTFDGSGWTVARVSAILRGIAAGTELTVNVNSPGGDFFEGVAIYNALRQYQGKVIVNVMGIAASAASIIAMAGDEINMGDGAFLMIHNAWAACVGNRNDMLKAAATLEPFDTAMASLYAARTGMKPADAAALMDAETWIGAQSAVDKGFASSILQGAAQPEPDQKAKARAAVDAALIKAGYTPQARAQMLLDVGHADPITNQARPHSADNARAHSESEITASLAQLLQTIQG